MFDGARPCNIVIIPPKRSRTLTPRTLIALILAALTIILLAACGDDAGDPGEDDSGLPALGNDRSDNPWQVVVSMPLFADWVREMGGDQVAVASLIPQDANPHTYVPGDDQIEVAQAADLVLVNGSGLDQPTVDFLHANRPDRRFFVVEFSGDVISPTAPQPLGGRPIYAREAADNAHLYMDPVLVETYALTAEHSLEILDPINVPYYLARYDRYRERLRALSDSIAAQVAGIPEENRILVTEHDSLDHFARRYGFEVGATIETDGEGAVRELLTTRRLPAVFTEVGRDGEALRRIAEEAGVRVCELYTEVVPEGMTYIEMMEQNAEEIADCLGA